MPLAKLREMIRVRGQREDIYSRPDFWNSKAQNYDGSAVSMWPNRTLNAFYEREQRDFLLAHLPNVHGLSILDVGCGTGRLSRHLAERGARVTAFDFAEAPVAIAKRQPKPKMGETTYRVQSIFELADENAYDAAVVIGALTVACKNAAELKDALSRIHHSLKVGGKFLLIEPIHKGFLHRVLDLSVTDFMQVMEETGLRVTSLKELHFWPTRLPLSLFNWPQPLTAAGYYIGQGLMRVGGRKFGLGDYKGLISVKVGEA